MPDADSRFDACLAEVLRQEGGYAWSPLDPGGATNLGITRRTLAGWRKVAPWWRLPVGEVCALGRSEAAAIYHALYWNRCNAAKLPAGLDLALFDFAVNSGPARAIRVLQRLVGARPDGDAGPLTLAAIGRHVAASGAPGLIAALCDARLGSLARLVTFAAFGTGWTRRVAVIRAAALAAAGAPSSPSQPQKGTSPMSILAGYKTYIVGAAMLIAAIAQLLGVELPAFGSASAGDLLMQGLAIIFLRHGIANTVAKG